jgi:hypothetical protein
MAGIPSLKDMHPRAWVEAMRELREQIADDAARVLDHCDTPDVAQPKLQEIFDHYSGFDLNGLWENRSETSISVEVKIHDDTMVFWVFPTRAYQSIVCTTDGYWWLDHHGIDADDANRHQTHRTLVLRLLDLLPWANDDELLEIAAIEIASRAG